MPIFMVGQNPGARRGGENRACMRPPSATGLSSHGSDAAIGNGSDCGGAGSSFKLRTERIETTLKNKMEKRTEDIASGETGRGRPLHTAIAARAQQLWESHGRPEGRDVEFWLEAERQLRGADSPANERGAEGVSTPAFRQAAEAAKPLRRRGRSSSK